MEIPVTREQVLQIFGATKEELAAFLAVVVPTGQGIVTTLHNGSLLNRRSDGSFFISGSLQDVTEILTELEAGRKSLLAICGLPFFDLT